MNTKLSWSTLVALIAITCSAQQSSRDWLSYAGKRFELTYPSSWHKAIGVNDVLYLDNFAPSESVHGVVIPRDGAEIVVMESPQDIKDKKSWIKSDLDHEKELQRRELSIAKRSVESCANLTEVIWEWEVGPKAYFTETAYYCESLIGLFRIRLTNWKGNPKQSDLQSIALEIAKSLKVGKGQP